MEVSQQKLELNVYKVDYSQMKRAADLSSALTEIAEFILGTNDNIIEKKYFSCQ